MTSSRISSGAGAGSGTVSIRTSRGPWKTAALTGSTRDLHLDVLARVPRCFECVGSFPQRESCTEQRRRVEPARCHESDCPGPEASGANDAPHLKCLRLDEPDLDRRASSDIDPDEHETCAMRCDRKCHRHR